MDVLKLACMNVQQAQDQYKKYVDTKRREVVFNKGAFIFLQVLDHSKSLKIGPSSPKLSSPRFCGPFKILKEVGSLAYKLKLPLKYQFIRSFM